MSSARAWYQDRLLMPHESGLPYDTSYWYTETPSGWNQVTISGTVYGIGWHKINENNGTTIVVGPRTYVAYADVRTAGG